MSNETEDMLYLIMRENEVVSWSPDEQFALACAAADEYVTEVADTGRTYDGKAYDNAVAAVEARMQ